MQRFHQNNWKNKLSSEEWKNALVDTHWQTNVMLLDQFGEHN